MSASHSELLVHIFLSIDSMDCLRGKRPIHFGWTELGGQRPINQNSVKYETPKTKLFCLHYHSELL